MSNYGALLIASSIFFLAGSILSAAGAISSSSTSADVTGWGVVIMLVAALASAIVTAEIRYQCDLRLRSSRKSASLFRKIR